MRILITGGMGFIGSNFVKYLFENYPDYKITVLDALTYAGNTDNLPDKIKDDSRFEFWYGNVRNIGLVNELVSKADIVAHFAAATHVSRSIFDDMDFFETDVLGTQVVANAVMKNKVGRLVHISTSEVYGSTISSPMTEEHPLNCTTPYAAAKVGADRLVYSYYKTYGIPAVILRPFNQYGSCQHLEKAIPRFITSALMGEPLTIHGTGNNLRDWNYVEDSCEAFDKAIHVDINKIKGEVINLGTGVDVSVKEIAQIILSQLNKPEKLLTYIEDRPGQVARHISSTDKSLKLLGWQSKTGIQEGITKTIKWYSSNKPLWEKQLRMRYVALKNKNGEVRYY